MKPADPNAEARSDPDREGAIDIGGIALPRAALAQLVPDIERFEAHLDDALAVDRAMKAGEGVIPDHVRQWPADRVEAVVATLKEVAELRAQAAQELRQRDR